MKKTDKPVTEQKVRQIFREEFEIVKEDLVDKSTFEKFKDQVLTLFDKVMGELKAIREELAIISGYRDQLEDHEVRIEKVEKILQT